MATEVVMPQMGESIAEGNITRWLVKVGDKVERDQPLFEISTDKVDAEIPSPAAGVLLEIRNQEGETVPVNQVVASIGAAGEAAGGGAPAAAQPVGAAASVKGAGAAQGGGAAAQGVAPGKATAPGKAEAPGKADAAAQDAAPAKDAAPAQGDGSAPSEAPAP